MAKRKKARMRIRPGCLVTVIAVIVAFVVLYLTPVFGVNDIVIEGNMRISKAEILIASGVREGNSIFAINTSKAKRNIMELGYIKDVKISRRLNLDVHIAVEEGTVAAYIEGGKGLVGISDEGQTLCDVSKASDTGSAAMVYGVVIDNVKVGQIAVPAEGKAEKYAIVLKLLSTFKELGIADDITEIDVSEREYITFRHRGKLKVELGDLSDYELKFNYIMALLSEMGQDVEGTLNMISENYAYSHTIQ